MRKSILAIVTVALGTFGIHCAAQEHFTRVKPQPVVLAEAVLPSRDTRANRTFIQLAWNGERGEIERVRLQLMDPLADRDLTLSWKTTAVVVAPGPLTGTGRIEWRATGALDYGGAGLVATFDGNLSRGAFSGPGRYWHKSGTVYEGGWRDGVMHGLGYLRFGDGRSYEGGFAQGVFDGQGVYTAPDRSRFEGQFRGGVRHGAGVETHGSGLQYTSVWVNGTEDLTQRRVLIRPEDIEPTLAQQLTYADLAFGVTTDRRGLGPGMPYEGRNAAETLVVMPADPKFVQGWRGGGTIQFLPDLYPVSRFVPVNLLMSLENRGVAPVQVVGGYLAVQSSTPDLEPYLEYKTPLDCGAPSITQVYLRNFGWSDPLAAKITGGFVSRDGSRYLLGLNVNGLSGWPKAEFDLGPGLAGSDPRLASLLTNGLACPVGSYDLCGQAAKSQGLFGALTDGVYFRSSSIIADYYGILEYQWRDYTGALQTKQSALRVPIKIGRFVEQNECGEGDGYDSPFPNPFVLPSNQSNYRFGFSLFNTLQPGTLQNWNFQIDSDMASRHVFTVVLQLSDGREVASRLIDLSYFKAKSPW